MARKQPVVEKDSITEYPKQSIKDIVVDGYTITSKYFAEYRLIPHIIDGLKPVYRRVLQSAYECCKDKFIKTATLGGHVIGQLHPHSLDATEEVINELVNAGLLIGDGEFGSKYLDGTIAEAASSRYTSVKLNPVLKDVFDKLLPYIPKKDGELEAKEYEYLPLPLPYMLFRGGFGLGPGLSTKTPAFTMKSMAEALKKNDPSKLKSTYGYTLLDKNQSFKRIWETGNGFMYYKLDTGTETLGDTKGFYLTGSAQVFFPKLTVLEGWKMEGLITIDEVGQGVSKLFIKRNKGVSTITNDEIYRAIEEASEYKDTIILKVIAPDGVVHPIGLQTWLNYSYNKFLELVDLYKEDKIKAIQKKIDLMKDLDVVRKYIIDHIKDSKCTPEMIAKATKKDISVVKEIDSWTVNKLRNTVVADELKKLNEQMHEAKQFDCNAYVNHVLKALDESCM
ncbi:MAG: hypothetical protein MJZ34_02300 [Paludibacteraceae bacterium]|nr:hypothetical protein [Paludibacteraceae bacterium]